MLNNVRDTYANDATAYNYIKNRYKRILDTNALKTTDLSFIFNQTTTSTSNITFAIPYFHSISYFHVISLFSLHFLFSRQIKFFSCSAVLRHVLAESVF